MTGVQVSARVDYAMRAMLELAARPGERMSRDAIAEVQAIPPRYLEAILAQLRQAGLVGALRGANGGFVLARDATEITVADVARVIDGPLTLVQGERPEDRVYEGPGESLTQLWVGLRASVREVLETVTLADLLAGELPEPVRKRLDHDDAWVGR